MCFLFSASSGLAYTAPIAYAGRLPDPQRARSDPWPHPVETALIIRPPRSLAMLLASWRRHLTAQRMSPATLATYSARSVGRSTPSSRRGDAAEVAAIRREHVEAFITYAPRAVEARHRPQPLPGPAQRSSAGSWRRARSAESPMARMKPPRLPEEPPPVLREADFRRLLEVCERDRTFAGRRDEAILRVLHRHGRPARRAARPPPRRRRSRPRPPAGHRQGQPDALRADRRPDRPLASTATSGPAPSTAAAKTAELWLGRQGAAAGVGPRRPDPRPRARGRPDRPPPPARTSATPTPTRCSRPGSRRRT